MTMEYADYNEIKGKTTAPQKMPFAKFSDVSR